jgi:hypothetical protein
MTTGFWTFVAGGTALYSPPFGRGGEAALFSVETLAKIGSPSLAIDVEHKNTEDTTWSSAGTFTAITTLAVSTADISGLKEEVRLKLTMTGTDGDAFNLLIPAPAWRPY